MCDEPRRGGLWLRICACLSRPKTRFCSHPVKPAAITLQPHKTSPAAAHPPRLAPPPAPRGGYTSWKTPRSLGGTVRPVTAPCGKLEGRQRRLKSVVSDAFVALAPTYTSTRGYLQPRYRGSTSRTSRGRKGYGKRDPLHRDRYAANRGSGGGGGASGGEVVRRDSPAAPVPRPPATPPMVRPVRGTHRAGRRRVG